MDAGCHWDLKLRGRMVKRDGVLNQGRVYVVNCGISLSD
jgi:hypothetical protein